MKQNFEEPSYGKALRREKKKRPRMKQHGKALKKLGKRAILHIVKVERKKKKILKS